ncbi:DUF4381 domain-containing protein [Enterovirga sp.]|uniref:DUF4381 domain-containing protein n=1 Tax=Enterovirga sp. TaxID=2026350 RepID=UPI002CF73B28|nr:DUF4381 domain-containing protein [Enterovirga sp.]HMO28917.1 DUF4381 domain-containing protein [Enterovirga sp.]
MSGDPGDLAHLRDLALPAPISFWPPAAGTWIVVAAGLAVLGIVLWRARRHYHAMAYRRAAIAELGEIAAAGGPDMAGRLSAVMKRVAMVEYGRERVASLTGKVWLDFVAETASGADTMALRRFLATSCIAPRMPSPAERRFLAAQASGWVRAHRVPAAGEA